MGAWGVERNPWWGAAAQQAQQAVSRMQMFAFVLSSSIVQLDIQHRWQAVLVLVNDVELDVDCQV